MPFEVRLSQLENRQEFEAAVASYVAALQEFKKVNGKPRPTAHPLVEACVTRKTYPAVSKRPDDYFADYVIIDDTPPPAEPTEPAPEPTLDLEMKKQLLTQQLQLAEHAAKQKVLPQRKMRLLQIPAARAFQIKEEDRTPDQHKALADWNDVIFKYQDIELVGAQAEAAIEDLTEDTIDSWQMPTFE